MAANNNGRFLNIDDTSGRVVESSGINASTGVGDAGKVITTDAAGRIDSSFLPVGVGPDVLVAEASEALSAGDYVNIFDSGSGVRVRLADNSNSRPAHGFVDAAVTVGSNATVFFEGPNSNVSGRTIGARQYLDVTGAPTETVPTGVGVLFQFLGVATSATEINTDIDDAIERC